MRDRQSAVKLACEVPASRHRECSEPRRASDVEHRPIGVDYAWAGGCYVTTFGLLEVADDIDAARTFTIKLQVNVRAASRR